MVYGIAYSPLVYKDELKAMGFAGNTALIEPVSIARSQLFFTVPFHHSLSPLPFTTVFMTVELLS